ncbi:DUF2585 domain-containing protein [Pelagerythrobacter aerophilus]|uniref:DUF2585 domain-containing protein n=2 Tax=Pelagerythrobacter aerophilus TaxID=2306995 RepID=A0A418NGA3_9SPHN|nr:DUF2585 domain-containing protein [Pelagerythrobacter aerophilus]
MERQRDQSPREPAADDGNIHPAPAHALGLGRFRRAGNRRVRRRLCAPRAVAQGGHAAFAPSASQGGARNGGALLASAAILLAMDRPPICECGTVKLWHGVVQSSENSQHLTDWYSPSHFTHGLIMFFLAWLLWDKWRLFGGAPARWALPIAVVIEAAWEIMENTPMVIDRYREVTISWGYAGDSMINSLADIGWMIVGFLVAARIPWQASLAIALFFEAFTAWAIRDNLTLNVLMLFWPLEAVRQWQGMG